MIIDFKNDINVDVDDELQAEIDKTLLPYQWLPKKMWEVVVGLHKYENFNMEFSVAALLSAAATAIGNSYAVRVKGNWVNSASFYMILVGRPGLGKTPPMTFAYRPIQEQDLANQEVFKRQLMACGENDPKPILSRKLISDFTPEAMLRAHNDNQRGICILVDEIQGMFNSADRYTRGQLIEQLLTAFSGGSLNVTRCNTDAPLHIKYPCISIAGTIQTSLVKNLMSKGLNDNGFMDRTIFVFPKNRIIPKWSYDTGNSFEQCQAVEYQWDVIMQRLLELPFDGEPKVLPLSTEANAKLIEWQNREIEYINSVKDESLIMSRVAKAPTLISRIALVIQLLKWASGEGLRDCIDGNSMQTALYLHEYFEYAYERLLDQVDKDIEAEAAAKAALAGSTNEEFIMKMLGDTFTTREAIECCIEFGLSERTARNIIKRLADTGKLTRISHGVYQKATDVA